MGLGQAGQSLGGSMNLEKGQNIGAGSNKALGVVVVLGNTVCPFAGGPKDAVGALRAKGLPCSALLGGQ